MFVCLGGIGNLFQAQASTFMSNLSVSVTFPALLPMNVSITNGAAAVLPTCTVTTLSPPAAGGCFDPTNSFVNLPQQAPVLTFTAGPVSGSASNGGGVTATSMGTSSEVLLGNNNAFVVNLPLTL